ncbi:single-stranded DNA-binding protein [Propionibacteriaceae bacterium G57]|uniref:single-stranded DNA-binding protein n=1 Tax=Aestuariimicrobium sp. G57 TaxID=3418485 RepID=UPI003DA71E70
MDALISLTGNAGSDVEVFEGDDWCYARFRLACTPRFIRNGEWVDGETTWITVRASNRTAVNVKNSIRKGDPVVVVGKLRTQAWTNAEGVRLERLLVEATSIGHDMSRGTSTFHRNEQRRPEEPPTEAPPGEGPPPEDRQVGEQAA